MALTPSKSADHMAKMREAMDAARARDLADQAARTILVNGCRIMPAIGSTGGAKNIGWELHRPGTVTQYFYDREQAEQTAMGGDDRRVRP